VFTTNVGLPIRRPVFSRVWRPACDHAGLPKDRTFHDLRHFYASLLIRHSESVETLDTYSHLWPDSDDGTRKAVDAAFTFADSLRTADSQFRHLCWSVRYGGRVGL
jgi:integrase